MNNQNRWLNKQKQLSNRGQNKEGNNYPSADTEMLHKLRDSASHSKMSENVASTLFSGHLTLYEIHALQQKKSELSLQSNKKDNFGPEEDVTTLYPNHLTLHELYERQGNTWKNTQLASAHSDKRENTSFRHDYLTLYEICQMKGLKCSNEITNVPKREFVPNPANKEFFSQLRNKRLEKVPEWIKAVWRKQSNQEKCEGSKIANFSEKENVEDDEQAYSGYSGWQHNNLKHKSLQPSGNYSQEKVGKAENFSRRLQQSCDSHQTTSINPIYKMLEKSPGNSIKQNGRNRHNNSNSVIKDEEFSESLKNSLERESIDISNLDDVPISQRLGKEQFSKEHILQREKHKIENENNERFGGQIPEAAASVDKDTSFCESMDQEDPTMSEWKEWSVKLLKDGQLCITGKCNGLLSVSKDVSHWKRIDARSLLNHKENIVYKLVGMPDHCVGADFPSFVQNKFQNGFPEDWLEVLKLWIERQHKGKNVGKTEQWLESNASYISDSCASSVQQHFARLGALKKESQKMLNSANCRKLEFSQLGDSSFRTTEDSSRAGHDIQQLQQPELINEGDGIRGTTFTQKYQQTNQIKYTVTLRKVPDTRSSFDETDTSFC